MTTAAPTTLATTLAPTTAAPTTSAPTTLGTTIAPTTLAPTTTLTTAAPTTTLTTAAPTTAVPDTTIEAGPIVVSSGVISDGIVIGIVATAGPITVAVRPIGYLSYTPAKPRDESKDTYFSAGPIEIELSLSGEQLHKWIKAGPIGISVTIPLHGLKIGRVLSAGPINISVSVLSYGISIQEAKCNWVKWGKIGRLDFEMDESNVAGERPLDWPGCVYKILKLGNRSIVYGTNGVSALVPSGVDWGLQNISKIGLLGPNAVTGNESEHYFINLKGDLYKVSESIEKLGYSEFLSLLTNPVMSLDVKNDLIYICDDTYGFIYSIRTGSLGEGPANITGISYKYDLLNVVAPSSIDTPKLNICTVVYDLGIRKPKTLHSIEVGTDLTEHLMASVDYRVSNRDSFKQIDWFLVNPDGVAYPVCYGLEFRFRLKSYIYEYIEIDYLKINGAVHNFSYRDYLSGGGR